jgi:hypothetical protein
VQTHHAGCTKRAYASRAQALLDMDRIREVCHRNESKLPAGKKGKLARRGRRVHPVVVQRAYPCPHCGCWHLTSQAAA